MTAFVPYTLDAPTTPAFGLVVLQVDETIEQDFRRYFAADAVRLYVSRMPSGADLTAGGIAAMETGLGAAAALLPPSVEFDVVGFACTSGAALLGPEGVHETLAAHLATRAASDPLTAACAQIKHLGLRRIGLVSPYIAEVAEPLRAAFEARGVQVPQMVSFGERSEARVARISASSIASAATELAARDAIDGIFLSCTNLRCADLLEPLSRQLGLPVMSSNAALAWHMRLLARLPEPR